MTQSTQGHRALGVPVYQARIEPGACSPMKRLAYPMYTILVQMADDKWTMEALHLACALARNVDAQVGLLRLIQVTHPSYLGTPFGNTPPNKEEYIRLKEYTATAEDYGIEPILYWMQCLSTLDAIAEAADSLDATVVFARVMPTRIHLWHRFQLWNLKRRFMMSRRQLFTLDEPTHLLEWTPSITVRAVPLQRKQPNETHLPV